MSAANIPVWYANASWEAVDPEDAGSLDNTFHGVTPLTSGATNETRSMAAPAKGGLIHCLAFETDGGGDIVVTVGSGYDEAGNTTLTFTDTGEFVVLYSVLQGTDTYVWRVLQYEGVTGPSTTIDDLTMTDLTATTITVSGLSDLQNVTMSGTCDIDGALTCAAITADSSTTAALQTVTVALTLAVTGNSTFTTSTHTGLATMTAANLSGDLDVDGTTTLDNTEVDGTLTLQDGGTVTQTTSTTTGVTLNANSGQITTVSSSLAAGGEEDFVVTNSNVAAVDTPIVCLASTNSAGTPEASCVAVAAGQFTIRVHNAHSSTALNNDSVINFNIIKGSAS